MAMGGSLDLCMTCVRDPTLLGDPAVVAQRRRCLVGGPQAGARRW
jgi:hypothetical protein